MATGVIQNTWKANAISITPTNASTYFDISGNVQGVYGALAVSGNMAVLNLSVSLTPNKTVAITSPLLTLKQYFPKGAVFGVGYFPSANHPACLPKIDTSGAINQNITSSWTTGSGGYGILSFAYELA